jgi:hypothetical protein
MELAAPQCQLVGTSLAVGGMIESRRRAGLDEEAGDVSRFAVALTFERWTRGVRDVPSRRVV